MAITPFKTFIVGEILTASDLNSSFTRITDNGEDVPFPSTKAVDFNGQRLILDADGDTSITADTDDQIDIELAGADDFRFVVNSFLVLSGSNIDLDGNELILDADGDTSITADTDDQIDIRIGGFDDFQFTPNTFSILSGSSIDLNGVGTILLDADGDLILSAVTDDIMQLGLVDVGAQGPTFRLFHDSSSPALNDIVGDLEFQGRSSTAVSRTYAAVQGVINDPTNASEDAQINLRGLTGGTDRNLAFFRNYSLGQQFEAGTIFWAGPTATNLYEWSTGADPGTTGLMALSSSGRLFIGDTITRTIDGNDVSFQVLGTAVTDSALTAQRFSNDAGPPHLYFGKSRGTTIGDYTIVNNNDVIGRMHGYAADGIDLDTQIAGIEFEVDDAAPAASSIGGAIVFYTAPGLAADDITVIARFQADGTLLVGGIDVRRVATAAVNGVIELATPAEADAGTDTTRAVTPEGLEESRRRLRGQVLVAGARTLVASDAGQVLYYTGAGDNDWTVNDSVFTADDVITVIQFSTGKVTLIGSATLNTFGPGLTTAGQDARIQIVIKDGGATTVGTVSGDLEA